MLLADDTFQRGQGSPIICRAVFMTLWRTLLSAAEQLAARTVPGYRMAVQSLQSSGRKAG